MPPAAEAQNVNRWTTREVPKENSFNLMVQYLEKFSTTTGMWGLASSDQARRVTDWRSLEEGEEVGDSRAEGSSAIGGGGQAALSLTPDIEGKISGSCWIQFYLLSRKMMQGCLGSSSHPFPVSPIKILHYCTLYSVVQ